MTKRTHLEHAIQRSLQYLLHLTAVVMVLAVKFYGQSANPPDLTKQPTLYVVGYAHLDTEWRWEYPQVIDEYLSKTMQDNFSLFAKYPHYIFNFSGANRYRLMKEYYPADFARLKQYVATGRWFPAGSSMEEGDVNAPSAESIFRQILYGNRWFKKEFGKTSVEYMLPDCFGFPSSLPTILAHSGVKGFSTQKLVWGSSADAGGSVSSERTPEGTPFNVGVWVGPDGESILAGLNPGSYSAGIVSDLTQPLPPLPPNTQLDDIRKTLGPLRLKLRQLENANQPLDPEDLRQYYAMREQEKGLSAVQSDRDLNRFQDDWARRVELNGKVSGLFTDYHYYGTGDIGGAPDEDSIKRLEAIVTKGLASLPPQDGYVEGQPHAEWPSVKVGDGPVHVVSTNADQMFRDIHPDQQSSLPRYTGEMELTNHSAGSLTSQAYQKRWLRKEEVLADAAEKAAVAAAWLGVSPYPQQRLNDAWTLVMGGQFHDIAAGTATPRSYEFAWNDDVLALNQFAGVLTNASQNVAAALDTQTKGLPIVIFNPLNIEREEVIEANLEFPSGSSDPGAVRVFGPDGQETPSQISNRKVLFVAKAPSVGYSGYDLQAGAASSLPSPLHISENTLENEFYRVQVNSDGDVSSIFDKHIHRELLAAPARLAISYDNPQQWPAWNMDWDQEQASPKAYVSGPAMIRIVERGPVRVALEIQRETAGSKFVQTIRLSTGDAGKRVEFVNVIDWNTRESNLKATFPLSASNRMATYNWDVGTIERPNAEPKKFEVPSHQWIDLTDMSGTFGATILTDCKNGSDKPNDNTIRLTLIRTPGILGGYDDQATQDIGHHEFTYGLIGHEGDWRESGSDWQGLRLNDPLIAFQSSRHPGKLGRNFSLLRVSNARIRVMALKKAEDSDEIVLRLVELDGKPQPNVKITFSAPIISAHEISGQEEPVGPANVSAGSLLTSFTAYQPKTWAIKLGPPLEKLALTKSELVPLKYDLAVATTDGIRSTSGFDGHGNSLPAEMLPQQITFDNVQFHLNPATTNSANALTANGQTLDLPSGRYNRMYLIAASSDGDQKVAFSVDEKETDLTIQQWGGFIGQWDNRQWIAKDKPIPGSDHKSEHDNYAEMTGVTPGYIKRSDVAWYCSHHHDAAGKNVSYSYSYLFAYSVDLPPGAKTLRLPNNDKIRILAISVAEEPPMLRAVQPLYDLLEPRDVSSRESKAVPAIRQIGGS